MRVHVNYLIVIISLVVSENGNGQSIWLFDAEQGNFISIEWMKPDIEEQFFGINNDPAFFSSVLFLSGQFKATNKLSINLDIPISHWELEDPDGTFSQAAHTTLGNIYLGAIYRFNPIKDRIIPSVEIGTRLPVMAEPDYPKKLGFYSGYFSEIDRREAFAENMVPIQGFINMDYSLNSVIKLRFRGGISYWSVNEDSPYPKNQVYLTQSIQTYFLSDELNGYFGLTGKYNQTEKTSFLEDDKLTQLRAGVFKNYNNFLFDLYIRVPLKDFVNQAVYGVQIMMRL